MPRFSSVLNVPEIGSTPATPASGGLLLYSKTADSRLYYKNDLGIEYGPLAPIPTNLVTTDTVQTISAAKTFSASVVISSGNFSITTGDYLVGTGNKYVFRYSSNVNYGLIFNDTSLNYQFTNSAAASIFTIDASGGGFVAAGSGSVATSMTSQTHILTGLTGATASGRWVGTTASGAPTTGTFVIGDWVSTRDGKFWICTVAGTPGTWVDAGAAVVSSVAGRTGAVVLTAADIGGGNFASNYTFSSGTDGLMNFTGGAADATTFLYSSVSGTQYMRLHRDGSFHGTGVVLGTTALAAANVTLTSGGAGTFTAAVQAANLTSSSNGAFLSLKDTTASQTTPNKYIRSLSGQLQFVNSTNATVITSMADTGAWNMAATLTVNGNIISQAASGVARIDLLDSTAAQTTPNKYVRSMSGQLQVVNSAYTTIILSLSDVGALTVPSITAPIISGNTSGQTDGTYFAWDATSARLGFSKKTGQVSKIGYANSSFVITEYVGQTTIDPANAQTDRLSIAAGGNATFSNNLTVNGTLSEGVNRVYSAGNTPPYPVTTVAGRTGAVVLTASDIGAGTFTGAFNLTGSLSSTGSIVVAAPTSGYAALRPGDATHSGYLEFFSTSAAARQGYIGFTTTTATIDTGTIVYNAGSHLFNGTLFEGANRVYSAGNVPPYPVSSVAGRTGAVTLGAADIAAGTFTGAYTLTTSVTSPIHAISGGANTTAITNNAGTTYGSVSISGAKAGYAGITFTDISSTTTMMTQAGNFGVYETNPAAWRWYFSGPTSGTAGQWTLTQGLVPWTQLTGVPVLVTSVASRTGAVVLTAADITGGTFPGNYVFTGNVTIGNKALWGATRTMPGSNNTVDIGTFTATNGAFQINLMLTVNASGFAVTKSYELDVTSSVGTASTWYKVLPQDASTNSGAANDFTLEVNRNATTNAYTFRVRQIGATGGTMTYQAEGYGDSSLAFTSSTATTAAPAAVTTVWSPTPLYMGPSSVGILTDNPLFPLDIAGQASMTSLNLTGLTGSTATGRLVGFIASGAPTTGAHNVGDVVFAQNGGIWTCTVAGTPGTWVGAGGGGSVTSVASRTGAVVLTAADIGAGTFPGSYVSTGTVNVNGTGSTTIQLGAADQTVGAWWRNNGTDTVISTRVGNMYYGYSGGASLTHNWTVGRGSAGMTAIDMVLNTTGLSITGALAATGRISSTTNNAFGNGDFTFIDAGTAGTNATRVFSSAGNAYIDTNNSFFVRNRLGTTITTTDQTGNFTLAGALNVQSAAASTFAGYVNFQNSGSAGYVNIGPGYTGSSGYLAFMGPAGSGAGVRQALIGDVNTSNATQDTGTLKYQAGTHSFTGSMTVSGATTHYGNTAFTTNVASAGAVTIAVGGTTSSGYISFGGQNGVRQGYIGDVTTNSGTTDGGTITYGAALHKFNGHTQTGAGYHLYAGNPNNGGGGSAGLISGDGTRSGYLALYGTNGNRIGYIGNSVATATGDQGTIGYNAGNHNFTGGLIANSGLTLGASQQSGPGIHSDGGDNVYIEAGSSNHSIYIRPNRDNTGMLQVETTGRLKMYDSVGNNVSYIGSNEGPAYGALTIGGVKNGWSGITFNDVATNQTMMVNASGFGVYDVGSSSWRWRFEGNAAGTGGEWNLAAGYIPWSRISGTPQLETASALITATKGLTTAYSALADSYITVPANSGPCEIAVIGEMDVLVGTGTNAAGSQHVVTWQILDEVGNVIAFGQPTFYSTAATNQNWNLPLNVGSYIATNGSSKTYHIEMKYNLAGTNSAVANFRGSDQGQSIKLFRAVRRS